MRYQLGDCRSARELRIGDVPPERAYFFVEMMVAAGRDEATGFTRYIPVCGWVTLDGDTGILSSELYLPVAA